MKTIRLGESITVLAAAIHKNSRTLLQVDTKDKNETNMRQAITLLMLMFTAANVLAGRIGVWHLCA